MKKPSAPAHTLPALPAHLRNIDVFSENAGARCEDRCRNHNYTYRHRSAIASTYCAATSTTVPSFCGLKASTDLSSKVSCAVPLAAPVRPSLSITASLSDVAAKVSSAALIATTAATLVFAAPALAAKVEVGDEVGNFKFYPENITVSSGESVEFTLVGETPHNIVFDIPAGASGSVLSELQSSSMGENDLLSEDEPVHTAKVTTPGSYTFYCTPHKSANMKGTLTVK